MNLAHNPALNPFDPNGLGWRELGAVREPIAIGVDPAGLGGSGALAVTRREGHSYVSSFATTETSVAEQVFTVDQVGALPPELFECMRTVAEEVGQAWAAAWHDIAPVMDEAFRSMSTAVEQASGALRQFAEALHEQPPDDPRERALWLRQHRNTGPAVQARAPRAINPRRRR